MNKPGDDLIKGQHDKYSDHFFRGVCICPCKFCTVSPVGGNVICICKDCPDHLCGAKVPGKKAV